MAQYDTYTASRVSGSDNHPVTRTISVLFVAGDTPSQVISAADGLLGLIDDPNEVSVEDALLAMPQSELVELLRDVWAEQMQAMGNQKYEYANQLRNAINYAQNA